VQKEGYVKNLEGSASNPCGERDVSIEGFNMTEMTIGFYIILCILLFGRLVRLGLVGELIFYLLVGAGGAVILGRNIFTGSDDVLKVLIGYFLLTIILAFGGKCFVSVYLSELDDEAKKYRK